MRLINPMADNLEAGSIDLKSRHDGRHFEQRQHIAHGKAAGRDIQQSFKTQQDRIFLFVRAVRNRIGNKTLRRHIGENGIDIRRIGRNIGHHDNNVAGFKLRVAIKQRQQLVVQYLNLPKRAVTAM